ncbi:S-layer homology domain-containing protein, partial [Candidatus Peregrinibacteria bacterium]|nr:S-layer homology domain-containing protein [Candidatus Peregrinibacteria bacterium]
IYEYATVNNFTGDAAQDVREQIGALTTAVSSAEDAAEATTILKEEAPRVLAEIEKRYESDKQSQLDAGVLKFPDLFRHEGDWYTGAINNAAANCVVNGKTNADGTRSADAGGTTSWAEALTMVARSTVGCDGAIPSDVDLSNSIVAQMPDYARAPVTYLLHEDKIDAPTLARIYANNRPGDEINRIEMMQVVDQVFELPKADTSVAGRFPDAARLDASARQAASNLVDAGVVNGQGNGDLDPNGSLNRAAFAAIMTRVAATTAGREVALPGPLGNNDAMPGPTNGEGVPANLPSGRNAVPVDEVPSI